MKDGVHFCVWAPTAKKVVLEFVGRDEDVVPMRRHNDGTWDAIASPVAVGTQYWYQVDGRRLPDPASRRQPEGVHGPSEIVNPNCFGWTDDDWRGISEDDLILYELHVGTFSDAGTFAAVRERLPYLTELGVSAIELMPIADFPGRWNWGYDGVSLFAPARCYGTPDELRQLINEAHGYGIGVILDVVYNHLGPDGNYLEAFSPYYFSKSEESPWGRAINFGGEQSSMVRKFFIENAMHWIEEYHIDGLRLDATHAISEVGEPPFVAELIDRVHQCGQNRRPLVIAEDHRNLNHMLKPRVEGGWELDGVWADDFHHDIRVALAKDYEGYYADFDGSTKNIAQTLSRGWRYCGQQLNRRGQRRGTDPFGIPPRRFVFCLQNHDQIGNRAFGDRLHHTVDDASFRAVSALLLCAPQTPLLFMGQEWAASSPFLFFTDHSEELRHQITAGRRREFCHFREFADPATCTRIPDPQTEETFLSSKLNWTETSATRHHSMLRLYQLLLSLRRSEPALRNKQSEGSFAYALSETTLILRRDAEHGPSLLLVVHLGGAAEVSLRGHTALDGLMPETAQLVFSTEDRALRRILGWPKRGSVKKDRRSCSCVRAPFCYVFGDQIPNRGNASSQPKSYGRGRRILQSYCVDPSPHNWTLGLQGAKKALRRRHSRRMTSSHVQALHVSAVAERLLHSDTVLILEPSRN